MAESDLDVGMLRVVVVEDFEPVRDWICSKLQQRRELKVVCAVSDGLEAVRRIEELQPDIILLDIGLPGLHGIEVARRVANSAPTTKILFVSQERSSAVVGEALRMGAGGFVMKSQAESDLLPAIEAVSRGGIFVSDAVRSI
jgi:DNA-binding NarL/FixJ family response regulator